MRIFTKRWALLAVLFSMMAGAKAEEYVAEWFDVDGIHYSDFGVPDGEVMVEGGASGSSSVVIPETIRTEDGRTFRVTRISDFAFFDHKGLVSVTLPASIDSIGMCAFSYCVDLSEIVVDEENESFSSVDGVLLNKDKTELLAAPNLASVAIPSSVKVIRYGAFLGCSNLTSIEIPSSVTTIEADAFAFTGLASVRLPSSVTELGGSAFHGCSRLASVELSLSLTVINGGTFEGCTSLSSIEIPASVVFLDEGAFLGCSSLTSLVIPASLKAVPGNPCGAGCDNLTGFVVDETHEYLTSVDGMLLSKDKTSLIAVPSNFPVVKIPSSVENISNTAFSGCVNLTSVVLPSSVEYVMGDAFQGCTRLDTLLVSNTVKDMWLTNRDSPLGHIVLLSEDETVLGNLTNDEFFSSAHEATTIYSTGRILNTPGVDWGSYKKVNLLEVDYHETAAFRLAFSLQCNFSPMSVEEVLLDGESVSRDANGDYVLEGIEADREYTLTVNARIMGEVYPLAVNVSVEDASSIEGVGCQADELQVTVRGGWFAGDASLKVVGDGGEACWTLVSPGGSVAAQGKVRADGNWYPLAVSGVPHGLYLLTVRVGEAVKTVKLLYR